MADWSALPSDILCGIALKLDSTEEFIYFSAVCHSWNQVFSLVKPEWSRARKPTPPWLLLTEPESEPSFKDTTEKKSKSGCRKVFSIRKNKCHEMMLPEITGKRCWGSSYGWIVMFGSDEDVQFFNPINKAHLSLPSFKTLPKYRLFGDGDDEEDIVDDGDDIVNDDDNVVIDDDNDDDDDDDDDIIIDNNDVEYNRDHWVLKYLVKNIFVLNMPRKDNVNDYIVMVAHEPAMHLAYARPGDRAWTQVVTEGKTVNQVYQVMCWKGKVLILYRDATFAYCDIEDMDPSLSGIPVMAKNYCNLAPVNKLVYVPQAGLCGSCLYIVELNGDLLAVVRHRKNGRIKQLDCGNWYRTYMFEVFKQAGLCWEKVEDLGDFLIFLGYNYASAVHISKAPNCQRNAIYFVDDEYYYYAIEGCQEARGHDMGMFDMITGKITQFYKGGDTISKFFPPIWFSPNF